MSSITAGRDASVNDSEVQQKTGVRDVSDKYGPCLKGGIEVLNTIKKQAFFSDSAGTFHL